MTLKQLRKRADLRQTDVAEKLMLSQGAISKWESAETRPCRKYHEALAAMYGVTPAELQEAIVESAR